MPFPKRLREQCEAAARMHEVPWVVDGVWVQVDDLAAHYERAREEGATLLSEMRTARTGGSTVSRTTRLPLDVR